jgi:hypothetical protein
MGTGGHGKTPWSPANLPLALRNCSPRGWPGQESAVFAKQHGHSAQTMLETYAAWLEGTTEADLRAIQKAMEVPAATKAAHPLSLSLAPGSPKSCH